MAKSTSDEAVLLSVQRALLGAVRAEMRAISVEQSPERIRIWVYHDGEVAEDLTQEFDSSVGRRVIGDFDHPDLGGPHVDCRFERVDVPRPLKPHGQVVFARYGDWSGAA
jgi:hypothetical protein